MVSNENNLLKQSKKNLYRNGGLIRFIKIKPSYYQKRKTFK